MNQNKGIFYPGAEISVACMGYLQLAISC